MFRNPGTWLILLARRADEAHKGMGVLSPNRSSSFHQLDALCPASPQPAYHDNDYQRDSGFDGVYASREASHVPSIEAQQGFCRRCSPPQGSRTPPAKGPGVFSGGGGAGVGAGVQQQQQTNYHVPSQQSPQVRALPLRSLPVSHALRGGGADLSVHAPSVNDRVEAAKLKSLHLLRFAASAKRRAAIRRDEVDVPVHHFRREWGH